MRVLFNSWARQSKKRKRKFAHYLRDNQTDAEKACNVILKSCFNKYFFQPQKVILGYIADFYCEKLRLIIEIDGDNHTKRIAYDKHRDDLIKRKLDVKTIRVLNRDVFSDPYFVKQRIEEHIKGELL